jgi:ankyrin repeat protein
MGSLLKGSSKESKGSLLEEVEACRIARVKALLDKNPGSVNTMDDKQETPLHIAARKGNREILELLLTNGADLNAQNSYGYTPLHMAALSGEKETVALLLAAGADVAARDRFNRTSLNYALKKDFEEVVNILKMHGAKEDDDYSIDQASDS